MFDYQLSLSISYRILLYWRLSFIKLPVQEFPSPVNPSLHSQVYELIRSIQLAFVSQELEIQSSMSKKVINVNFIKVEK